MKTLFIIIGLSIFPFAFSQRSIDQKLQNYLADYKKFNFQVLSDSMSQYSKNSYNINITRDLDFGIKETLLLITLNYPIQDGSMKYSSNMLHILSKDSIIIGIICQQVYRDKTNSYWNEKEITDYINKHNSMYQTQTSNSDLINDLTKDEVYGYSCGLVPVMGGIRENDGLIFGDLKNIDIFRKWLKSYNPELQTYGADAITDIYKTPKFPITAEQNELEQQDKNLVKHIKERNSIVNTCSGCFVGIYKRVF